MVFEMIFNNENGEEIVECKRFGGCGWRGNIGKCSKIYVHTDPESWMALAGREGYEYLCPECHRVVTEKWIRIS